MSFDVDLEEFTTLQLEVERLRTALALTKTNFEEAERLLYLKLHEYEAEVERLREANAELQEKTNGWARRCGTAEGKLSKATDEVERLRAENAELCEQLALKTQANEDAQAQLVVYDKLIVGVAGGELAWFRRLYEWLQDHVVENGEGEMCTALQAYVIDNPKPGSGTVPSLAEDVRSRSKFRCPECANVFRVTCPACESPAFTEGTEPGAGT